MNVLTAMVHRDLIALRATLPAMPAMAIRLLQGRREAQMALLALMQENLPLLLPVRPLRVLIKSTLSPQGLPALSAITTAWM